MTGIRIKQRRKQLGMTQLDLARKLGVDQQRVGNWEKNKNLPNRDMLVMLESVLQSSISWLLSGEERVLFQPNFEADEFQLPTHWTITLAQRERILKWAAEAKERLSEIEEALSIDKGAAVYNGPPLTAAQIAWLPPDGNRLSMEPAQQDAVNADLPPVETGAAKARASGPRKPATKAGSEAAP